MSGNVYTDLKSFITETSAITGKGVIGKRVVCNNSKFLAIGRKESTLFKL